MRVKEIVINGKTEQCCNINLIVGANNTGKTTFVANFYHRLIDFKPDSVSPWVNGFTIEINNFKSKYLSFLKEITDLDNPTSACHDLDQNGSSAIFGTSSCSSILDEVLSRGDETFTFSLPSPNVEDEARFFNAIATLTSAYEHPENRLSGPYRTNIEAVDSHYHDLVHYLFAEEKLFLRMSEQIKSVFGIQLVFDDLQQGLKQIRLALAKPIPAGLSLRDQGIFWESNSKLLQYQGNGVRAYWQLLFSLINPIKSVIFMDEPEIFLHSPQRRSLGQEIGNASKKGKQFFIATHDSEFIRGILSTYPHVIGLNGKAAVKSCFKQLKAQGIKTVSIYDFDSLRSGEYNDRDIISEGVDWNYFDKLRQDLDKIEDEEKKQIKAKGLVKISDRSLRERTEKAITKLEGYGIFFVPLGELESWQDVYQDSKLIQNLINEIEEEVQKPKKKELKEFLGSIIEFYQDKKRF